MKDRVRPCIHYICKGSDCAKGIKNVDLAKCKNCSKYCPRKCAKKQESVRAKRQKDKDRHDRYYEQKYSQYLLFLRNQYFIVRTKISLYDIFSLVFSTKKYKFERMPGRGTFVRILSDKSPNIRRPRLYLSYIFKYSHHSLSVPPSILRDSPHGTHP